jgi:uncharacterized coiled-coil protein SlyX
VTEVERVAALEKRIAELEKRVAALEEKRDVHLKMQAGCFDEERIQQAMYKSLQHMLIEAVQ